MCISSGFLTVCPYPFTLLSGNRCCKSKVNLRTEHVDPARYHTQASGHILKSSMLTMSPPYLPKGKRLNVATGYQGNKIDISTYNNLNSFLNHLNLSFSASTSINTDTVKNNLSLHDSRKKTDKQNKNTC